MKYQKKFFSAACCLALGVAGPSVRAQDKTAPPAGSPAQTFFQSAASATGSPAKRPGAPRLGVIVTKANLGASNGGSELAQALQTMLVRYLNSPDVEVISITSMPPAQMDAEISRQHCDFVMYASLEQKRSGKGLLQIATMAASMTPIGMAAGTAGSLAGMAGGSGLGGLSQVAGALKAKSEVILEYKLSTPGNATPVFADSLKTKVKADGEDVISTLIGQAASAILARVENKPDPAGPGPRK